LNVNVAPFGGSIFVHLYRSVGSLGNPLCGNGYSSPAAFSCPIRGSGRYVLAAENAGSFTPLVIRPTRTVVVAPGFVKGGGAIAISAVIRSNAPNPTGTCIVQEQSGGRWLTDARVHTSTGTCHARVVPRHRDKVRLRVHFKGAKGWASSTSKPVTVGVG
jgi:hypothetical protein